MKKINLRNNLTSSARSRIVLSGCGGGSNRRKPKTRAAPPAAAAPAVDEANAATITGKVSFTGDKPKVQTIDMSANPACARAHATRREVGRNRGQRQRYAEERFRVGEGPARKQWPTPTSAVKLEQKGCMYNPHVIGVMTGQDIEIMNTIRPITTSTRCPRSTRNGTNRSRPGAIPRARASPAKKVADPVKCNVHPWMRAYIGVVATSVLRRDRRRRKFTIKGLPRGPTLWKPGTRSTGRRKRPSPWPPRIARRSIS